MSVNRNMTIPAALPTRPRHLALAISAVLAGGLCVSTAVAQDFPATLNLSLLDGNNGFRLDGVNPDDRSGRSVSAAGDINGDGVDDLIVGAFGADPNALADAGSSYVVFGRNVAAVGDFDPTLILSALDGRSGFRLDGVNGNDFSGFSVSAAGDINGDGVDDLIVGAFDADPDALADAGSSYVVFGRNVAADGDFDPTLTLSTLDGRTGFRLDGVQGDFSGRSVSAAGDINGDGVDDLIVSADGAAPNGNTNAGSSYVVFGRDVAVVGDFDPTLTLSALDGRTGFRIDGVNENDSSGYSVSEAGDINGDGVDDLIVGAFGASPNGNTNAGSSYVVFGRDVAMVGDFDPTLALSVLDGRTGFRIDGVNGNDFSGFSVSAAGDINGDGVDDLIVGAPGADPNGNGYAGSSYVVFGRDAAVVGDFDSSLALSTLDGRTGFRIDGVNEGDLSGFSVSAAGDINGDGVDDLIVGAYDADPNGNDRAGSSYVVFGRSTDSGGFDSTLALSVLDGSNGFRLDGVNDDDNVGYSVSAAGDINGDGVDDVIVGALDADPNSNRSAGSSYVVFGGNDGPGSGRIEIQADTPMIDLGGVPLGGTSSITVSLANQAITSPQLGSLSLQGSGDISIEFDTCSGQQLEPAPNSNDTCTFEIEINLDAPGLISGQVIAPYNSSLGPEVVLVSAFPDGVFIDSFENLD